ncbi:zf-HC2 domain-containing protein [Actinokineospora sp. 24-640]
MECETCREALSARLDGEAEPVDAHLADCAACRAWHADAADLTRALRVREAVPTPDLADAVLAADPRREPAGYRRLALGVVAVAQLTLGMAQLLGVTHGPGHSHVLNESSAWTIALGAALAYAAFRPAAATGVLVATGGFLGVLTPFAVIDLAVGAATASRVATHAILLLAVGLLIAVRPGGDAAGSRRPSPGSRTAADQPAEPVRRDGDDGRSRLRPVSRKSAA